MVLLKDLSWAPYRTGVGWSAAEVTPTRTIYRCNIDNHATTPRGHYWAMIMQGGRVGAVLDPVEAQCLVNQWLTEEGSHEAQ